MLEYEKNMSNREIVQNFQDKYEKYKLIDLNKKKYNQTLTTFRLDRTNKRNEKTKVFDNLVIGDRYETEGKTNLLDLLMSDRDNIIDAPLLTLPNMNEKLWISKTIGTLVN